MDDNIYKHNISVGRYIINEFQLNLKHLNFNLCFIIIIHKYICFQVMYIIE